MDMDFKRLEELNKLWVNPRDRLKELKKKPIKTDEDIQEIKRLTQYELDH